MTTARTILLVDDDASLRAGLQTMLQQKGYRTLEAGDGLEAKDLINQHRPDLVVMDMMMPRWGGFAVLEHFQNNPEAPRFVMLTGHDGERHKAYAKRIGVVEYIHKPCPIARLVERIDNLMNPSKPETPVDSAPSLRVVCPACGARIKASARLAGQTRKCPGCSYAVVVREMPIDEGPRLV